MCPLLLFPPFLPSHSWSKRLLGESAAKGFSQNIFLDELESKTPLIESFQEKFETVINLILTNFFEKSNQLNFINLGVKFTSPFEKILKDRKKV